MAEEKLDVGVIGLGKFGLELALTLSSLGHNVVGLDAHEERVRMAQDDLATVYRGNATDITVLRQLRLRILIRSSSAWAIPWRIPCSSSWPCKS